jgi:5-methylcytosine-specific restriction endonuclease McrA
MLRRHAGSGTKRERRDRRDATYPRGATETANFSPSRLEGQPNGQSGMGNHSNRVFVLDARHHPLMPCHPARARELLAKGLAVVIRLHPFTIRLKRRMSGETQPVILGIDPGSQITDLALARTIVETRSTLWLGTLQHRGAHIRKKLEQRRRYRRRRRSANLRYRAPRFYNRRRREGWLPPSLQHRVDTTLSWVLRLQRLVPVSTVVMEIVKFDTQAFQNPDISGIVYQQGTLYGYEVREYLIEKWGRQCVYCHKTNLALQLEHIIPTSRGGTNRITNLTLACERCNQEKGSQTSTEFGHPVSSHEG